MRTEFNPAKLGAFIAGAFLLAVIALLLWGSLNIFPLEKYVIFFAEPANGLDVGAPVRLFGVAVGKVESIQLYSTNDTFYSAVVVQLDPKRMQKATKGGSTFNDWQQKKEVFAQLGLSGLVSLKLHVDLDVVEPGKTNQYKTLNAGEFFPFPEIPSRQSTITMVVNKIQAILNSADVDHLLSSITNVLNESDTNRTLYQAKAFLANANHILTANSNDFHSLLRHYDQLATNATALSDKIASTLRAVDGITNNVNSINSSFATNFASISSNFAAMRTTLAVRSEELGVVLRGAAPLPPQAAQTLRSLQDTLESFQRLTDYLERHPDSVLRGRQTKE